MIAYLRGSLIQKKPNQVVVDVGGVGYCALIPISTYLRLGEVNEPVALHVYSYLTDNSFSLCAFSTQEEKDIFLKLVSISGIGPKIALNILSGIEASDLEEAIRKSDIARLTLIPGVGKKTALRIALELQEKLEKKEKLLGAKGVQEKEDLISALQNLGFRRREVERIVEETVKALSLEAGFDKLLRECLRSMAKV